jgi:hypothetical protein
MEQRVSAACKAKKEGPQMKINRLTSIALAALALALVGSQLVAHTSHSQDAPDNNVKKNSEVRSQKSGIVIVRDKSKPVRRALEEMYAKIAEAQRNKDIEALRATRTPDFTVDLPNGRP